jgi:MFS transporter, DHA1 family, multidrug resistance protein
MTSRAEEKFERYGGDDIHEPSPKEPSVNRSLWKEPTLDGNMVTWNGPEDPTNPQNWSIKYKWLVTAICMVITVNVYV